MAEGYRESASNCWFTYYMPALVRPGSGSSQEPALTLGSRNVNTWTIICFLEHPLEVQGTWNFIWYVSKTHGLAHHTTVPILIFEDYEGNPLKVTYFLIYLKAEDRNAG